MKNRFVRWQLIVILILTLLMSTSQSAQAYTGVHNATQKKDINAWGAWAYIIWTNPNLNGGSASYHRVAVLQWSPWRFVENGWRKLTTYGIQGLIAYDSGSGTVNISYAISGATHRYSMQYDPNTGKYWFYLDGANVYNVNANLGFGDAVMAGGEVFTGVEAMAHTKVYDLRYLKRNSNGTFTYVSWNGHVDYAIDAPYYNTNIDSNSFYDDP